VEDCDDPEGIFWSKHPETTRPEVFQCIVQDDREAGNGDGVLNPGETVRVILDIRNWTRKPFHTVFSTDDLFVTDPRIPPFGTVMPGRTERSGSLTIAPDCPDGQRISFNVKFKNGSETWSDTLSLPVEDLRKRAGEERYSIELATHVEETESLDSIPGSFTLGQNFPNPFNAETVIPFDLPEAGAVKLTVYTVTGGKVAERVVGHREAGHHSVTWDGQDERGIQAASGVYVYRLEAEGHVASGRMTLVK